MVAPTTPALTELPAKPPITFGLSPLVTLKAYSSLRERVLFTLKSSG
jgi:hypothetical protein